MQNVKELSRHSSPGGRPQPLAHDGTRLWVGSWDTDKLYAVDPQTWNVLEEVPAPGAPFGLTAYGDGVRAVVSLGEDDRYFYHFVPGRGFDESSKTPCPDFTGSHLAADGKTLYMTQLGLRRILAFDESGRILRQIALPTRCVGIGMRDGTLYMISADDEFENLKLATLDIHRDDPDAVPLAAIPFDARGLVFDGRVWWTSHREERQVVSFET